MENITIGSISEVLMFVVALIGSVEFLYARITKRMNSNIGNIVCEKLSPIKEEIKALKKSIDEVTQEQNTNEMDRIRYEVLQFSGSLRNGIKRTENDYTHIEEIYEKYLKKGGNSYVHSEMEFIRKCHNNIDNILKWNYNMTPKEGGSRNTAFLFCY